MGQISPLDQLIFNSAFNDCSVTVIYSGVITADVLLVCDGPWACSPSLFCANVIVFFGTTASFTVVLCIFVVSSSAKYTFPLVAWLGDGVVWPMGLSSLAREIISFSPPPLDQSWRSLFEPHKDQPSTRHASTTFYYQMCIHVRVSTSVTYTFMLTLYLCVWECVHRLSEFQYVLPVLVQTGCSPCVFFFLLGTRGVRKYRYTSAAC